MKTFTKTSALVLTFIATTLWPSISAHAQQSFPSSHGQLQLETKASDLEHPWGLAFLPDGNLLITQRSGALLHVSAENGEKTNIENVPEVYARRQGGLLDVHIPEDYETSGEIYLCYAKPEGNNSSTALYKAQFDSQAQQLVEGSDIFIQQPALSRGGHYGCRIETDKAGFVYLTTGDYFTQRDQAQNLENHIGKLIRLNRDGSIPQDNPFVNQENAMPEIFSLGHRNAQGAAIDPVTDRLWTSEHGARGGDEINLIAKGNNYGWPVITYGVDYSGMRIGIGTRNEGMEQPKQYWDPSIAPSGLTIVQGDMFPQWRGNLIAGALKYQMLVRLEKSEEEITNTENLLEDFNQRIRDVTMGPDGAIWFITDEPDGQLLRLYR